MLDYYAMAGGLLVEDFVLADDHTLVAIDTAAWSAVEGWVSGVHLSQALRRGSAESRPLTRSGAAQICANLPAEDVLRMWSHRYHLPLAPPLRLGSERVYRILCSGTLTAQALTELRVGWPVAAMPSRAGIVVTAVVAGVAEWDLRQIGEGAAWSVYVRAEDARFLGPLLLELRQAIRMQGLVPVTVEQF